MPSRPPRMPPPPPVPGRRPAPAAPGRFAPPARVFPPPRPFAPPGRAAPAQPKTPPAGLRGRPSPPPPTPFRASHLPRAVQRASDTAKAGETKADAIDMFAGLTLYETAGGAAKKEATGNAASDAKTSSQFVKMHEYGAGTGELWTTPLGNCMAVIAHDAQRGRAALTHSNTEALFSDIFKAAQGVTTLGDAQLPEIKAKLKAVRARLLSLLPGATESAVAFHLVLGMVWAGKQIRGTYEGMMKPALAEIFGASWDKLVASVALTARFDAATGKLTTSQT